ncbi:hypothetical protein [Streptomyces sp. 8N706]|uniref:hypothetical protein n=1 Tax=Streptomyces sp. 8N706 TaxID=3457416 RepID=UPI003FD606B1
MRKKRRAPWSGSPSSSAPPPSAAFGTEEARRAHLEGKIAKALLSQGARLLSEAPDIRPVDVLAAKLPDAAHV